MAQSGQSEKDLGFTMDEKFDFGEHIKTSPAKANIMIAWVSIYGQLFIDV